MALCRAGVVYWLHADHLGSLSEVTTASGGLSTRQRYSPYGLVRSTWGRPPTTYHLTGQREESTIGLYFYNARWYDAPLGRFIQPDTIVPEPGNPQALNRYSYVLNNPVKYVDPTGKFTEEELLSWGITQAQIDNWKKNYAIWWEILLAAQLGDWVTAMNPFTSGQPRPIGGQFSLIPAEWKVAQRERLYISGYHGDLDRFGREARHHLGLSRLGASGYYERVQTPNAVMRAAPPETVLYFDASAVNWLNVFLDIVALASGGIGRVARKGSSLADTMERLQEAGFLVQAGIHTVDLATGNGDPWPIVVDALGMSPGPIGTLFGMYALTSDLAPGFKLREVR